METWKYINDFHMQVFQMARLPKKIRERFKSDMRIIVDFLAEGTNYIPSSQPIVHIEAFLLLLKNLTNDERYEQLIPQLLEEQAKGEIISMCPVLDKYINIGIRQGRSEGLSRGEADMLIRSVNALIKNLSMTLQQACESIGSSVEAYENAKTLIAHANAQNSELLL